MPVTFALTFHSKQSKNTISNFGTELKHVRNKIDLFQLPGAEKAFAQNRRAHFVIFTESSRMLESFTDCPVTNIHDFHVSKWSRELGNGTCTVPKGNLALNALWIWANILGPGYYGGKLIFSIANIKMAIVLGGADREWQPKVFPFFLLLWVFSSPFFLFH